uniref:Uncharacterized protein n=1 Tax=Arundo donax TaxID=35708 RepID=A0A0A9BH83_ARUDO
MLLLLSHRQSCLWLANSLSLSKNLPNS